MLPMGISLVNRKRYFAAIVAISSIPPGDYVVVRQKPDFVDGEIGIAIMDDEATVKRLRRVGRKIELKPANRKYPTRRIDPAEREFHYGGKVVGVHRFM